MNQIKPINNPLDRQGRNDFNHNFGVLDKRTKATNQTIETLVIESGTSDAEIILARNGEKSLKVRLDKTDAYIDRQDEQILLQSQRYADTLGLDGNVSVDDLESIVFKDDYQAEWEKNLRDYEELKVGTENLFNDSKEFQEKILRNYGSELEQLEINENMYSLKTTGGTSYIKGLIRFNDDYLLNLNSVFAENEKLNLGMYVENKAEYTTYIRLQGFKNSEGQGGFLTKGIPSGFKGFLNYVSAGLVDGSNTFQLQYRATELDDNIDLIITPLKISVSTIYNYTPSPKDINASPFTVKLANDYYQQQSEITELRNAILQLGGQ